jgi:hypothetical protein
MDDDLRAKQLAKRIESECYRSYGDAVCSCFATARCAELLEQELGAIRVEPTKRVAAADEIIDDCIREIEAFETEYNRVFFANQLRKLKGHYALSAEQAKEA